MTDKTEKPKTKAASTASTTSTGITNSGNGTSDMMMAVNATAIDVFTRACRAGFYGWASMNSEVADFMAKRFKHDADLSASLARCESWEDAVALQRDWAREAAEEYMDEANRLMELSSRLASDQWKPVWQQADEMVSTIAKNTS